MRAYVLEPDTNIQEYYRNLLGTELRTLELTFVTSVDALNRKIDEHPCDIVITESFAGIPVLSLIEDLATRRIPVIVVSEECNERLIVECLKAGALDFLSKRNIKLGLLLDCVRRAFLEADRWAEARGLLETLPARPEFIKATQTMRGAIAVEQAEVRRARMRSAIETTDQYEEGKSYDLTFVFVQIQFPESLSRGGDEARANKVINDTLDRISALPAKYGGQLWVRRRDGGIFVFNSDRTLSALFCCLELRGYLNIVSLTTENLYDSISVNMSLVSGMTVYKKNIGDIHSDALNLAAHLAIQYPKQNTIFIPQNDLESLSERARKYFFRGDMFEGRQIYFYEKVVG